MNIATQKFGEALAQGQAESGASVPAGMAAVGLREGAEEALLLFVT